MYSVKFFMRDPKAKSETTLNVFITYQNDRIKLSTGIKLHPELWDTQRQKVTSSSRILSKYSSADPSFSKNLMAVNAKLAALRGIIQDYSLEVTLNKTNFSLNELKERLISYLKPVAVIGKESQKVLDYLENFIKEAKAGQRKQVNGSSYRPGTIANYKNLRQTIQRFESTLEISLEWDMIDRQMYSKFIQWQEDEGFSLNYTGKHCKDLKSLMRLSFEDGIHENHSFRSRWFAVPGNRTEKLPLTETEIKALNDLALKPGSTLCKARDLFLISCYTGLRIGDIRQLKPEVFIENDNGRMRINIISQKTNRPLIIPVSTQLHKVLNRYNYHCPKIAEQTANRLIKKIALIAGVPEKKASRLSMHIGRHSFVTHLYHSEELPMVDIMQITGHSTERNFMRYVNARPEDSARRMEQTEWFK